MPRSARGDRQPSGVRRVIHPEQLESHKYESGSQTMEAFTPKDGLTDDLVTAVLEDREGNIWFGTNSGLDSFRKGKLTPLALPFPLVQPVLCPGDAGTMWISSNGPIVQTRGEGKFTSAEKDVLHLFAYRDSSGVIWWSGWENRNIEPTGTGFVFRVKEGKGVRIPPKGWKSPVIVLF